MRCSAFAIALAVLPVAGCTSAPDLQAQSVAQWKAYCTAHGKQFLWHDTQTDEGTVMRTVKVEGKCVGPGERGYLPPPAPGDEP